MQFLSNFNTLVEILVGSTDLLESNEDMIFSIPDLSVELTKKKMLDLFLRKLEKCLCENEILSLVLLKIQEKQLLKIFEIAIGLKVVVPLTVRLLEISEETFLIVEIDFESFHVLSMYLVPVGFKIMIVVIIFDLLQNCRQQVSVVFMFLMKRFFLLEDL